MPKASDWVAQPEPSPVKRVRKLVAGESYFGLEARAFHAGAQRMLARIDGSRPEPARINVVSLGEDFSLLGSSRSALLTALLTEGLLQPDGDGSYQPTIRFNEYAQACVVWPLSRAGAQAVLARMAELADRINSAWIHNPYLIEAIAVSGSYMSRCDPINDLRIWLVVRRRRLDQERASVALTEQHAIRQISASVKALSSFIDVRAIKGRDGIPRPFAIVFEGREEMIEECDRARGPWWGQALATVAKLRR